MASVRVCGRCGRELPSGSRAKYCQDRPCRQSAYEARKTGKPESLVGTVVDLPVAFPAPVGLAAVTRSALEAAGRLDTPLGQLALSHAELLASSRAVMGRAPLAKELRDTLAEAMKDADRDKNTLDEINDSAAAALALLGDAAS